MIYLVWCLPALAIVGLIASGRSNVMWASLAGAASAIGVAALTAPLSFGVADATNAALRGAWLGWIVVPYILGGLLFWQIAARRHPSPGAPADRLSVPDPLASRRALFSACFLIGPFAEAATGFGVGIVGTMAIARALGVRGVPLLVLSLLSQTMIPWGAMGSGSLIGAAFAGRDPTDLVLHSAVFIAAFHVLWLPLFWRVADRAGLPAGAGERVSEVLWLTGAFAVLIGATAALGPETAMLAAYAPMIVLRWLTDIRPGRFEMVAALRRYAPFVILIGWLALTRLVPPLRDALAGLGRTVPFMGSPAWSPVFHAGTWLLVGAVLTALAQGRAGALPAEAAAAWRTGRLAIVTIVLFATMAEALALSGIAQAIADGLFQATGRMAVVLTPLVSGVIGALTNNGSAANGLFMASQVRLAQEAGLDVAMMAALQHVSGTCMSMFSPVRMAIVCGLAGTPLLEREGYRAMLPFALATVLVLLVGAAWLALA